MKLTLGAIIGVITGATCVVLGRRYTPALLWWLFGNGKA